MKTKWLGLALAIVSAYSWAGPGELSNADIREMTSISDPAKVMKVAEGQWMAFSLPVPGGTRSPCCWMGTWSGLKGEVGCSLERRHGSFGTRSDSPLAENVIVYSKIQDGQVHNLRVFGEFCPVEANGAQVTWIGDVDDKAGLDWLEDVARLDTRDSSRDSALFALALHRNPDAGHRLYALAMKPGDALSEQAVFWLGETRGQQGSQMLLEIAMNDQAPREVRRQALFWLAQSEDDKTVAALTELLTR